MKTAFRRMLPAFCLTLSAGYLLPGLESAFAYQDEDDKEPPEVSIESPKDGAEVTVDEPLLVRVKATDDKFVRKVYMHINGQEVGSIDGSADPLYSFTVKDIKEHAYTFKAVAEDMSGKKTSSKEVTVTGVPGKPKDEEDGKEGDDKESDDKEGGDKEGDDKEGGKDKEGDDKEGDDKEGDDKEGDDKEGGKDKEGDEDEDQDVEEEEEEEEEPKKKKKKKAKKDKKAKDEDPGKKSSGGCSVQGQGGPLLFGAGLVFLGFLPRRRRA